MDSGLAEIAERRLSPRATSNEHSAWKKSYFAGKLAKLKAGLVNDEEIIDELIKRDDALEQMAMHDTLTSVFSRGFMEFQIQRELRLAQKTGQIMAVVYFDVDDFAPVNKVEPDQHTAGDRALIEFTKVISEVGGKDIIIGRWAGDEFLGIVVGKNEEEIIELIQKIGSVIGSTVAQKAKLQVTNKITASIGVAMANKGEEANQIIARADALADEAKKNGKNRMVIEDTAGKAESEFVN